jgi:hypothetical protein
LVERSALSKPTIVDLGEDDDEDELSGPLFKEDSETVNCTSSSSAEGSRNDVNHSSSENDMVLTTSRDDRLMRR